VRLRLNGNKHQMSEGSRAAAKACTHCATNLRRALPAGEVLCEHPEYFSLVEAKRQSGYAQLCLTNPEVLKICIAGVRQWIKDTRT